MAGPPKKRQRREESEDDMDTSGCKKIIDVAQAKEKLHTLMSNITEEVEAGSDISLQLLKLKSLQRQLLEQSDVTDKTLKHQAKQGQQLLSKKQNLQYQQRLHKATIDGGSGGEASTHLSKLAKSVVGETADNAIPTYLNTLNWQDPTQRQVVLEKLNQEMSSRQKLQQQLDQAKQALQTKQAILKDQRDRLQKLPKQLAKLTQASEPLQHFMNSELNAQCSSQRLQRVEKAKQLSPALYALYHQLESCLDMMESLEGLPTLACTAQQEQVTLTFPIPFIGDDDASVRYDGKSKTVAITFRYTEGRITAECQSKESDMHCIIGELFPGDTGVEGSYQWSNYLGGIYIGAASINGGGPTLASTKAILKALVRRVRATVTLSHLLGSLFRKTISMHPKLGGDSLPSHIHLLSWTLVPSDDNTNTRTYQAVLKNHQSKEQLTAKVSMDMARYPSVPPEWNLDDSSGSSSGLYNESLANLEKALNTQCLHGLVVEGNDESTYEWILSRQLWELARQWGSVQGG